jgi:hypothetical protein
VAVQPPIVRIGQPDVRYLRLEARRNFGLVYAANREIEQASHTLAVLLGVGI